MRVIMTGGGTGGHIYPAIAIADKIREKNPEAEILFVGTERGLEKTLVPQNGYPIEFITVSGFNRKNMIKNIKVAGELFKGSRQSQKIIKEFKPDVVIGTGGYVCGPVVRAAHKMGIKTFIHEQNAFPGITNKILEKHVDKVFISFEGARRYFKRKEKLVLSGNPVRQSFFQIDSSEAREKLGIPKESFNILCFGGSRGAEKINEVMKDVAMSLNGVKNVSLYFVTGSVHYDKIMQDMEELNFTNRGNIQFIKYINNMQDYLAAANLVICRAGALTLSELTVCGKASVLIPSPFVTGNHQYYNAKAIADEGAAILIEEKKLTPDRIMEVISEMQGDPDKIEKMEKVSRELAPDNATEIIYSYLTI